MGILADIGGVLSSRIVGYAGIAASVALGFWLIVVEARLGEAHGQIAALGTQLTRAAADLATCHGNVGTLNTALDGQSAELQRISTAGEQRKADAEAALKKLDGASQGARMLATAILAMKPQQDACKAAYDILGRAGR